MLRKMLIENNRCCSEEKAELESKEVAGTAAACSDGQGFCGASVVSLNGPARQQGRRQREQLFQLNKFKHALIGRLMLNKGDKPRQTRDLKEELQGLWKPSAPWHLMPLGKGYYTLKFQSQKDKAAAKEKLLWELSVGSIRLREWVRYFDPYKESSSIAQIWVRIYYLPVELWHPEVILGIGRWLGQPLKIDGISMTEDVGSYMRMLVEVDLAQPLPETMNIDGGDYSFPVEFCYESIPLFCTRCKITGHSMDKCRRGAKSKPSDVVEKPMVKDPQWKTINKTGGKQVQENRLSALVNVTNMKGELNVMEEQHNMQQQVSEEEETVNKTGGMHVQENRFSALIDVNNMEGEHTSMEEHHGMQQQTSEEKEFDAPDKQSEVSAKVAVQVSAMEHPDKENCEQEGEPATLVAEQLEEGQVEDVIEESSDDEDRSHGKMITKSDMNLGLSAMEAPLNEINEHSNSDAMIDMNLTVEALGNQQKAKQVIQIADSSLNTVIKRRGRPRKQDQIARNHNNALKKHEENIKSRLRNSIEAGHKPNDYIVDYSNTSSMRIMDNVVNKRWSDEVEAGGTSVALRMNQSAY
ncbi:uncharacterized protein LOC130998478 [Salvia miltiorrhiza]|uniref:uncharacterized protein LOC130998478 n=1 Tax=Salvia miltiorrhiza TaxID=226208 RepID=UPI0025AC0F3A|nr:uncharacterized protein LOC130998478 [Salvia miltiorrhiza]